MTGRRAIYVRAGECVGIVGRPDAEALPLIQELSDFVTRPDSSIVTNGASAICSCGTIAVHSIWRSKIMTCRNAD